MSNYMRDGKVLILSPQASLHPMDRTKQPCRCCKEPTVERGWYTTFAPGAAIAPNGRDHFRVYALCPECRTKAQTNPAMLEAIEVEDERRIREEAAKEDKRYE